ncbi:hypothetical protein ILP86_04515 [Microbacterium sp. R1]|uniref:Uncharacterized protein n=1 Tax=Microbacterium phage vB_MoxS-R1 TaxID=2848881 RepID=A0A8F2IV80_9CAUD|nr:hypothetical protein [Microbacterium sp. R1]YP_010649886.1 hypothetical protein PP419_gp06 [Microbacterium phage vB_MoxS-R1]MBE7953583.1 hypothetical protein [Microbacterium sp. R1]QWT28856.1 hypothetical protein vBMoxSR1_gp6 [Microbacterium phage vB_MoxS-R1]
MNTAIVSELKSPRTATGPTLEIIDVSPDLAQRWLGLNVANRDLKPHAIAAYARDMLAGRWALNGDAIRFSGDPTGPEKLLDGQNRLHAILRANITVKMLVMFGINESAQMTMDSGAKRSVADNLKIQGHKNNVITAAAANIAMHVTTGRTAGGGKFTNATLQAWIDAHPEVEASASVASKFARRTDVAPSMVAYTHWVFAQLSPEDADAFWRDAAEKIGLRFGDPVIALTNLFSDARRNRRTIDRRAQLSAIYRAWNSRRAGKSMTVVKLNSPKGGLIEIPEPK